ncbi:dehydrogenase [Azorhizobium oxalatiphilum]|uniref:Dehydrogenase n=1 Tax=Azorhizobium oxalatiphilum TaxID=980631 RepID=A0A917FEJ7_9HYPH|nr:PQQ-dependent sugar dehydrogenase [Azorhizobium oxalatiphilum]GGF70268.1 dehydrogenase [Azorhizobium oxalatiphilum]
MQQFHRGWPRRLIVAAVLAFIAPATARAAEPENAGSHAATTALPFKVSAVASFDTPWAIAFLDATRMLVTEKPGKLWLVSTSGEKVEVTGVPKVTYGGQNGLLDVTPAPDFATSGQIYLTYVEPGDSASGLALARARLVREGTSARLDGLAVIWRQLPKVNGIQPGGIIAFTPDGKHLFLTSGDRGRAASAQDPDSALGKLVRLNLDGTTPSDNPMAGQGGVKAQTWSLGHRNPYGLAFAADGKLWMHEMGPRGGDELNLILPGKNYGWPLVSNGDNYSGTPIPRHTTRPDLEGPKLYWTPVIAPAGLAFYESTLFPQWRGSALIGGLKVRALVRVTFGADGTPHESDRWQMEGRIRDVAVAPDGAVWLIEDRDPGRLLRLTPK